MSFVLPGGGSGYSCHGNAPALRMPVNPETRVVYAVHAARGAERSLFSDGLFEFGGRSDEEDGPSLGAGFIQVGAWDGAVAPYAAAGGADPGDECRAVIGA